MLRVNYKKPYGYALMLANDGKTFLKVDIYCANCLLAMVFKKRDLIAFFSDLEHLKRCFKPSDPIYAKDSVKKFVIYPVFKGFEKVVKYISLAGFEVVVKTPKQTAKKSK